MATYLRFLLSHKRAVLALLIAITGAAAWSARRIELRFALRDFYDYPGNPGVALLDRYHADFGDPGGFVTVLVEADDVFKRDVLEYIRSLTRALEPDRRFVRVHSLTNAKAVFGDGDDVRVGALLSPIPATQEGIERARKEALGSELLRRRLVSPDSRATAVLAETRIPLASATIAQQKDALDAVSAILAAHPPPAGIRCTVTGAPAIEVEGTRLLLVDQLVFFPVAVLIMFVLLLLTFRSWHGIILSFTAVLTALAWTFGVFPLFHRPADMISSAIPATLLVYGAVDPIFVLTRFLQKLAAGRAKEQAIYESYAELGMPCFLTSLTTALGFFSFATLKLPTITTFGWVVGLGVSFAWVTTMTVLPLLLSSLPAPAGSFEGFRLTHWVDGKLAGLWGYLKPRLRPALSLTAAALVLFSLLASRQVVSASYIGLLPPGEVRDSIRLLEQKLTGVQRTAVYIEGKSGDMKKPEVLRAIANVDAVARGYPQVESTVSLASLVAEMNQAFNGGAAAERKIPESKTLIAQYLALLDPEDRSDFVDQDASRTHIRILSEDGGSQLWRGLQAQLQQSIDHELTPLGIHAGITGFTGAMVPVIDSLVMEMIAGFFIGFLVIVVVTALIFRSLRVAAISIVPNLLPALACFMVLSALGITLRVGTVLFLSVSIGGLFNTTIHMAARVRQRLLEGETDPDAVVEHALRKVGPPALFTAVILSLGFSVFILSRFPDLRVFGIASMTILLAGFVSDIAITTVLLRAFYAWPAAETAAAEEPAVAT